MAGVSVWQEKLGCVGSYLNSFVVSKTAGESYE